MIESWEECWRAGEITSVSCKRLLEKPSKDVKRFYEEIVRETSGVLGRFTGYC